MLGEDHSLLLEFPEYKEKIAKLTESNSKFAADSSKYHKLDKEIRSLELANAPIEDAELHNLKQRRAKLKDLLFQTLQASV